MCSDCSYYTICSWTTDPRKTGVPCPSFRKRESRYQWMHDALNAYHASLEEEPADEPLPAWVLAMEDAYDNREMPWYS